MTSEPRPVVGAVRETEVVLKNMVPRRVDTELNGNVGAWEGKEARAMGE